MKIRMFAALAVFSLAGCFAQPQAERAVASVEASAMNYRQNVQALVEAMITDYRAQARKRADELSDAAVASITKPDGSATAKSIQAIEAQRLNHYAAIERNCLAIRAKLQAADADMANVQAYSAALKSYFQTRADTGAALQAASDDVLKLLEARLPASKAGP